MKNLYLCKAELSRGFDDFRAQAVVRIDFLVSERPEYLNSEYVMMRIPEGTKRIHAFLDEPFDKEMLALAFDMLAAKVREVF